MKDDFLITATVLQEIYITYFIANHDSGNYDDAEVYEAVQPRRHPPPLGRDSNASSNSKFSFALFARSFHRVQKHIDRDQEY